MVHRENEANTGAPGARRLGGPSVVSKPSSQSASARISPPPNGAAGSADPAGPARRSPSETLALGKAFDAGFDTCLSMIRDGFNPDLIDLARKGVTK